MAQTQANACNALLTVNWGLFYLLSMDTASHGALPHGACDSPQEAHDSSTTGTSGEDQGAPGANSPECGEKQSRRASVQKILGGPSEASRGGLPAPGSGQKILCLPAEEAHLSGQEAKEQ